LIKIEKLGKQESVSRVFETGHSASGQNIDKSREIPTGDTGGFKVGPPFGFKTVIKAEKLQFAKPWRLSW
jgi:hypothetical protein